MDTRSLILVIAVFVCIIVGMVLFTSLGWTEQSGTIHSAATLYV